MESTELLAKVVGPVLLLRAVSIVIDRQHFINMVEGLEKEVTTVAFSLLPIALLMAGITIVLVHHDTSSLAAILFHIIAWGAIAKSSLLILFPSLTAAKARLMVQAGFLNVVLVVCLSVGAYLTWFGYLR